MAYTVRRIPIAGKDRTEGEEFKLSGSALRVELHGARTTDITIAFDSPQSDRVSLRSGDVHRTQFSSVWVFHPVAVATEGPLELTAMGACDSVIAQPPGLLEGAPTRWDALHAVKTVGDHLIAVPDPGASFRLLGYRLAVMANSTLAAAGILEAGISIAGVAVPEFQHRWFLPAAAPAAAVGALDTGLVDLGAIGRQLVQGQALGVRLSAALVGGELSAWIYYAAAAS